MLHSRSLLVVDFIYEVKVLVAQSCPTLCDPMDCSPPGSSVHGILHEVQSRLPRPINGSNPGSCIAGRFFTVRVTQEATFYIQKYVCVSPKLLTYPSMPLIIFLKAFKIHKTPFEKPISTSPFPN